MGESPFLYIFLLVNFFLLGVLATIAWQHARAHFKPHEPESKKPRPAAPTVHVPADMKEKLLDNAQDKFAKELNRSATQLQHDLQSTSGKLTKQLEKLGDEIVKDEMKRYHDSIDQMRQQANTALSNAQSTITDHQAELENKLAKQQEEMEAKLAEDMAAEKQQLLEQIDTKLADAVASFLTETLQHDVDLGAQADYLTKQLEAHKADFKKGVSDEITASK